MKNKHQHHLSLQKVFAWHPLFWIIPKTSQTIAIYISYLMLCEVDIVLSDILEICLFGTIFCFLQICLVHITVWHITMQLDIVRHIVH